MFSTVITSHQQTWRIPQLQKVGLFTAPVAFVTSVASAGWQAIRAVCLCDAGAGSLPLTINRWQREDVEKLEIYSFLSAS